MRMHLTESKWTHMDLAIAICIKSRDVEDLDHKVLNI